LECQIYIDVNCTDVQTVETDIAKISNETLVDDDNAFDDSFTSNLTDSTGKVNVSEITADETLATSELSALNPNKTSEEDLKKAFCRDMARVARSYEQKLVAEPGEDSTIKKIGKGIAGATLAIIIIVALIACCVCVCVCKFLGKIKDACFGESSKQENYVMASTNDIPPTNVYPTVEVGYPTSPGGAYPPPQPGPTLYPNVDDPGLPPPGPAIPPTQPGYPANPDPYNTSYPPAPAAGGVPYPPAPAPGGMPYPPAPAGGVPYPPVGGSAPPPPYEAHNPYPAYPPTNA